MKISFKSRRHKHHHTVRAILVPVLSPLFVCQLFVLQRPQCFINHRASRSESNHLSPSHHHTPPTHTPPSCVPACLTTGSGGSRHTHTHTHGCGQSSSSSSSTKTKSFPLSYLNANGGHSYMSPFPCQAVSTIPRIYPCRKKQTCRHNGSDGEKANSHVDRSDRTQPTSIIMHAHDQNMLLGERFTD